ncbi:MAG: LacI family DNA-binding transcriptional regulator [Eubacteriales bacterium]|nr:LacI family DNA-binding transcriptional regulator [Eubacteriales bacterium]
MITMQQIAEACGVSRGTVDRALHNKPGIRPEVAARIREKAREMGYISARLAPSLAKTWNIGVVLHSAGSGFVQALAQLLTHLPDKDLLPVNIILRTMHDIDVQHQIALIDELVEIERIDGLALMPLANSQIKEKINTLSEKQGIPVVTLNTDISDANRIAYIGPDNLASGRSAAALMGLVTGGHGHILPVLGQQSGHYADSQRLTGFAEELQANYPQLKLLHPECCFLDTQLAQRITARAIQSDPELSGIYVASVGRHGVANALRQSGKAGSIHVIMHDITPGNLQLIREGIADFVIGQDVQAQGSRPIHILYEYLSGRHMPENRIQITDISIKFRCNI